jgi:hypothetical protein
MLDADDLAGAGKEDPTQGAAHSPSERAMQQVLARDKYSLSRSRSPTGVPVFPVGAPEFSADVSNCCSSHYMLAQLGGS